MDIRARDVIRNGDFLYEKRGSLLSFWQHVAEHFYPERAHFTATGYVGEEFATNLETSYPLLARRELGNAISAMLRQADKEWFHIRASREEREDHAAKVWLERATRITRRAMYDRRSQFTRATKEGDHDFAAFGQCVISVELSRDRSRLLYRDWHLRDMAWCEGYDGTIDTVHRNWRPTADMLRQLFRGKIHARVADMLNDQRYREVECRHIIVPTEQYDSDDKGLRRFPFVSLHIDVENEHVMEEVGAVANPYVIPRWQTVSGSQYAYSPAVVAALPDARLIQAMTAVLLDAGEKAASPPMLAVQEAIRGDIDLQAGGVTYTAADYDERLGEVLRPMTVSKDGLQFGIELRNEVKGSIADAFFLNRLSPLPVTGDPKMTAFEAGQRIQDYIRNALPLFEPMEMDYNGSVCEATVDLLLRNGAYGPIDDIPQSLRGDDLRYVFESPLHEAIERQKAQRFTEGLQLTGIAAQVDPSVAVNIDVHAAFRDALEGVGFSPTWIRSEEDAGKMLQAQEQAKAVAGGLAAAQAGGQAMEGMGKGAAAMAEAQQQVAA